MASERQLREGALIDQEIKLSFCTIKTNEVLPCRFLHKNSYENYSFWCKNLDDDDDREEKSDNWDVMFYMT